MPRKARKLPWLDTRNGVYYANWYEGPKTDGCGTSKGRTKSLSLHTSDPAQAAAKFASFLGNSENILGQSVATLGVTVSNVLDSYELEHVNTPKVVAKTRQIVIIRHLRAYFGETPLKALDIPASRAYAAARRAVGISDSTIRRELTTLVAAINHARRWKRLNGADPSVELTQEKAPDEAMFLTREEVAAVHAAAVGPVKDFIILAYYTGARRASIERLRVEQVKLAEGRLNLRKAGEVATKKRRPLLAIHPRNVDVLTRLVADAKDGWLFGPTICLYDQFRTACRKAGIDTARAHPHILRHSRATHLLQSGKSLWDVAKQLGDTVATVERVYGHHCPDHQGATNGDE